MSEFIDIYCERTAAGLLNEPVNFLTNAAFLVAAVFIFSLCKRAEDPARQRLFTLATLSFAIGIGSGLFHSFATRWAMLADTIPIGIFIFSFWHFWLRTYFAVSRLRSAMIIVSITCATILALSALPPLPVAKAYLLPLGILFVLGGIAAKASRGRTLLLTAFVFSLSLTFRSIDLPLCETNPLGTHFLWHILNGATLALCSLALFQVSADAKQSSSMAR